LDEKAKRDYKDEYKKFQSSDKSKKYRAELNKYNRDKGTYGNGDCKDASHKKGKITGFEAESKNRGRREKSRLKKESKMNFIESELKEFVKYMNGFYGPKGVYPDKKKRILKVNDIKAAYSVLLKKKPNFEIGYDSVDREMLRDILIRMGKLDPEYNKGRSTKGRNESTVKITESKLRKFIKEEIQKLNQTADPKAVLRDIRAVTKKLDASWKRRGPHQLFGQKEIRALTSRYIDPSDNSKGMKQIRAMIKDLDRWVSEYKWMNS